MKHKILIVEGDPIFRQSFVTAVKKADDLLLVGSANDLPKVITLIQQTQPDIILIDIALPGGNGIELIRQAHKLCPECDVLVVTLFGDEQHVLECFEAGATGYLLKDSQDLAIVEQIRSLRAGGSPISPPIARQLLMRFLQTGFSVAKQASTNTPHLSEQEHNVLEMSTKGYRYEEIARLLKISPRTVETYVKRIYSKLQVHNKSEAVYEARKLGLIKD